MGIRLRVDIVVRLVGLWGLVRLDQVFEVAGETASWQYDQPTEQLGFNIQNFLPAPNDHIWIRVHLHTKDDMESD